MARCRGCGSSRARYSSAQSFAIPYGDERLERRVLGGGTVALAVDRAARRREDDLRARRARRLEHAAPCRRTFTSASKSGRFIDVCTSACAARWKTTSAPAAIDPSRMSRSTNVAAAFTFSRLPDDRSSTTVTSSPRSTSASTRFDPMNPAPPVTTARTAPYRRRSMFVTFEGIDGSGKIDAGGAARATGRVERGPRGRRDARARRHGARRGDPRARCSTGPT